MGGSLKRARDAQWDVVRDDERLCGRRTPKMEIARAVLSALVPKRQVDRRCGYCVTCLFGTRTIVLHTKETLTKASLTARKHIHN